MKRYIKSAVILLAALSLAACTKTDEPQYNPDNALQIESVSGISPFAMPTKAVITGETLPTDESAKGIGLFVTATDGSAYDGKTTGYSNMKYTYSSAKWSAASPVYLSNTTGKLYGYFPYNVDATDLTAIPVASSLNGTDYLYATKQDVSFSNKSVDLQMNHALARLHLTIKKGNKYLSDCNLTKIVLQSKAIDANGTMDITTGAITATKAADATGTFTLTGSDAVTAAGITKDILLVPADNTESKKDLTLILTIDGVDAEVKFTADKGLDIRSGIQNNVTLTIEDTGIKVTGVGVGVWGEGGSQAVEVGGHTVTVKLADEAEKDVFLMAYKDGDIGKIEAFSKSGKTLGYAVNGKAACNRTKTGNFYSFVISEITSNVTVEIGYKVGVENITLDRTSVNPAKGWIVYLLPEISPADATIKDVIWSSDHSEIASVDGRGNVTAIKEGTATITAAATDGSGISASCTVTVGPAIAGSLPHEFSVSANKKVHFSKGNLWADSDYALHFEDNQWAYSIGNTINWKKHASLFTWNDTVSGAVGVSAGSSNLFCDEDHKISVDGSAVVYYTPSVEEWENLFICEHKFGINVCGQQNCAVLLPDNWVWDANTVGGTWQDGGYLETSTEGKVSWKTMEDAGAVCLPPVGYRIGNTDFAQQNTKGFYWTSTPSSLNDSWCFDFTHQTVEFREFFEERKYSLAVRLVTDVQ